MLKLDGKVMENGRQFDVNLYQRQVGTVVQLTVLRGGQKLTVPVRVVERPDRQNRFAKLANPDENYLPELGIFGLELDAQIARMFPSLRGQAGVVVAAPSAVGGHRARKFLPGDVIYSINRVPIKNLTELREATANFKVGDAVVVQVERRGRLIFITFEWE